MTIVTMQVLQAYAYSIGVDVRPGLYAAERLLEFINGKPMKEEEGKADMELLAEMHEKLEAAPGYPPKWTDAERERWKLLGDGWRMDEVIHRWDGWLDILGGGRFTKSLPLFRARVGKLTSELTASKMPTDEWLLPLRVELADFTRRIFFQRVALVFYWQQASQEDWQTVAEEDRDSARDFVEQFTEERLKKLLGDLPIAERRRLEAMKQWTPEEWAQAGVIEP